MVDMTNPRKAGRDAIEKSVPPQVWQENGKYCDSLRRLIAEHPIMSHPILAQLEHAEFDLDAQRFFHLEFRHAFAQIFTDALIQAMVTSAQVEPALGAMGKVASRFLLQLNALDELGFVPNPGPNEDYIGHPSMSHYVQFDETLRELGLTREAVAAFKPSAAACACRATFEDQYADHVSLTAVMAVSETVFSKFSGPWSVSVGKKTGIDVAKGYHSIHVEHDGQFIDDDHSEDAWFVFRQAITSARYDEIMRKVRMCLDTWVAFLDALTAAAATREGSTAPSVFA